jgi:hypothetical protein
MSRPSPKQIAEKAPPRPIDVVRAILHEVGSVARLMEAIYLVQEPGMLDIMRRVGALSDGDRARLRQYLVRHRHLRVGKLPSGVLTFEFADETPLDKGV